MKQSVGAVQRSAAAKSSARHPPEDVGLDFVNEMRLDVTGIEQEQCEGE